MIASPLADHHTVEELETAYRLATRATERSRWQIIWLKKKGKSIPEIMDVTGYSRWTISRLIAKYNSDGVEALIDQRRFNGLDLRLSDEQQETLREVIKNNPDNQWTSEKVRIYILEEFKIEMTEVCAWGYLKRLGFSFQQPRPKNLNSATDEDKVDFVKKSLWR